MPAIGGACRQQGKLDIYGPTVQADQRNRPLHELNSALLNTSSLSKQSIIEILNYFIHF